MFYTKAFSRYLIIIILVLALKLLLVDINKPFWGLHDWNSAVYSNIARNYVRYGYLATKLGQVTNVDFQSPDSFSYITHYPPLLPILISFSFGIFGQTEAAARLTVIFFSIILVYFIYLLGKEIHSTLLGIFSALSTILTPIFLYFGKLPVHDTVVPAVSIFGFWAYVKFIKEKKSRYYIYLVVSLIIGGLINWSAFYLAVAISYHQLLINKNLRDKRIFALIPLCVIIFSINLIHIHLLGVKSGSAFSNLLERINPYITADLYGFTFLKYAKQELLLIKEYYTLPVFLGSAFFFLWFMYSFMKKKLTFAQTLLSALFVYGIIQIAVFEQLSFIHDYMIYYLSPYLILSFSLVTFKILGKLKTKVIYPVILISLASFIFLDNLPFTNALLATSMHERGYNAAKIIKSETFPGEKAFIGSGSYKEFEEVFIAYYSDRQVAYGEKLPENFANDLSLVVRPKDHDALDTSSKSLLDREFPKYEDGSFIWYTISTALHPSSLAN